MCDRVLVIVGRENGSAPGFLNEEKEHASQGAPHAVRILSSRRRPVRLSGLYCHGRPAAPSPLAYALPWERQPLVAALRPGDVSRFRRSEERRLGKECVSTGRYRW